VRTDDIVLCLIGIGYFLLIHNRARGYPFSKEFFVGFLFSIATAVPTWTRLREARGLLLSAIFTFGVACWLNCVAIQTWEDAEARREGGQDHFARARRIEPCDEYNAASHPALTNFLGNHLTAFSMGIGALAFSIACFPIARIVWPLFIAVAASSLIFLALIRGTVRFGALSLRVLADGALLTPLLFFFYVR
jgi:hypothetical protein